MQCDADLMVLIYMCVCVCVCVEGVGGGGGGGGGGRREGILTVFPSTATIIIVPFSFCRVKGGQMQRKVRVKQPQLIQIPLPQ